MPHLTKGFYSDVELLDHFDKHGHEFGCYTPEEYEDLADTFLGTPRSPTFKPGDSDYVYECVRPRNRDIVRYKLATDEFGILSSSRYIKTYYKPGARNKRKYRTNVDYWREQCQR